MERLCLVPLHRVAPMGGTEEKGQRMLKLNSLLGTLRHIPCQVESRADAGKGYGMPGVD